MGCYIITGAVFLTDCNGAYKESGTYDSHPAYVNAAGRWLWWHSASSAWLISNSAGETPPHYWSDTSDITGTWDDSVDPIVCRYSDIIPDAISHGTGTWSHTVGSGNDRLLIVGVCSARGGTWATINGVTYNGVSMVKVKEVTKQTTMYLTVQVYMLYAPASGAHNIVVDSDGITTAVGVSYEGAQQSNTPDANGSASGNNDTGAHNYNITTVADNCWVFNAIAVADSVNFTLTNTEKYKTGTTGNLGAVEDSNGPKTPAGAVSVGFSGDGSYTYTWAQAAISIAPAVAGTAANSERSAVITGKAATNSERAATIKGKVATSSERAATTKGKVTTSSERSAKITGIGAQVYSRQVLQTLPANDADLATFYNGTDLTNVATSDDVRVALTGSGKYFVHQFKKLNTNVTDKVDVAIELRSNLAPSSSSVYLQIYNHTTAEWETLDTESAAAANTDFTLSGTVETSLEDYYNANQQTSFRIYQGVI